MENINHITEIFFVGTLFKRLVFNEDNHFRFSNIIEKMIKINPSKRYTSFTEISQAISKGIFREIDFSTDEKNIYRRFSDDLCGHIAHYIDKYSPIDSIQTIITNLAILIRNSSLEEFIQDNSKLIECFINYRYSYRTKKDIEFRTVSDFYELVINSNSTKQKILFDNIYNRLSSIAVELDDDLIPF